MSRLNSNSNPKSRSKVSRAVSDRFSPFSAVLIVVVASALIICLLQLGFLKNLYNSELRRSADAEATQNERLKAQKTSLKKAESTVTYAAKSNNFKITAPDNFSFIINDDSTVKGVTLMDIELVQKTNDNSVLDKRVMVMSGELRAHQNVFGSGNLAEWIKNESGNQVDTTKLVEEKINGINWSLLAEPNNYTGHRMTFYYLQGSLGYRMSFFCLGDYGTFETQARQIMSGISLD